MFFTSVGPQDTHCHTMYLLQLGTGFDRVLNTLALYGVVQLNSQTNASFTKTMSLCFCHLLAQEWSKSVSFPNAMVQLVLMGGGVMASSLVPAETSFYIQTHFFKEILEFNCPALSHAAVSISCMAGAGVARFPALFLEVLFKGGTWLG